MKMHGVLGWSLKEVVLLKYTNYNALQSEVWNFLVCSCRLGEALGTIRKKLHLVREMGQKLKWCHIQNQEIIADSLNMETRNAQGSFHLNQCFCTRPHYQNPDTTEFACHFQLPQPRQVQLSNPEEILCICLRSFHDLTCLSGG